MNYKAAVDYIKLKTTLTKKQQHLIDNSSHFFKEQIEKSKKNLRC